MSGGRNERQASRAELHVAAAILRRDGCDTLGLFVKLLGRGGRFGRRARLADQSFGEAADIILGDDVIGAPGAVRVTVAPALRQRGASRNECRGRQDQRQPLPVPRANSPRPRAKRSQHAVPSMSCFPPWTIAAKRDCANPRNPAVCSALRRTPSMPSFSGELCARTKERA